MNTIVKTAAGTFERLPNGRVKFNPNHHQENGQFTSGSGGSSGGESPKDKPKDKPKKEEEEIVEAELVDDDDPAQLEKVDGTVDKTVDNIHKDRKAIKGDSAKKELEKTGLNLRRGEKGGLEAKGHTQEEVIDGMEKAGWIKINTLKDPHNPDFQLDIFEKGGKTATVHGQSESERKKLGRGNASTALPPFIRISE